MSTRYKAIDMGVTYLLLGDLWLILAESFSNMILPKVSVLSVIIILHFSLYHPGLMCYISRHRNYSKIAEGKKVIDIDQSDIRWHSQCDQMISVWKVALSNRLTDW